MLRPERMSRVSVTGSKRVMDDAVDAIHGLNLLHVTEYDGAWEGFEPGDPVEGADEASDRLVTVRSLISILGVEREAGDHRRVVTDEDLDEDLPEIRERVNELDDRRDELTDELRSVEERLDTAEPFVDLGIDLDLLSGYDTLTVGVGEGDAASVRSALADAETVDAFEVFAGEEAVGAFVSPADAPLSDLLVGAEFTAVERPAVDDRLDLDADGQVSPGEYVDALERRRRQLESKLETVEANLEDLRHEFGDALLAAEEQLASEVQKDEAPLTFATTDSAFVAEGWVPTERVGELADALDAAVGDHAVVEELERADYDEHGHAHDSEEVAGAAGGSAAEPEPAADGGDGGDDGSTATAELRSDGGHAAGGASADRPMSGGDPPVVQDNPAPARPFELLVETVSLPKYREFDPTIVLFLTFPAFFGFMIGDLGYGLGYMAVGYLMYQADSDAIKSLGGVALWAGGFTALFGVLYGEFFGLHQLGEIVWGGSPPMHKGLQPHYSEYALAWLVISLLAGVVHLAVGWAFDFYQNLSHGFADAMYESGSWLLMLFGIWTWILSGAAGKAPGLLVGPESVFAGHPIPLGFTGFSDPVGLVGLAAFVVGLALLLYGEPVEGVEFLNVIVNVLSYVRIAAVLLAKAGMAFVVNLLFFGVYVTGHGEDAEWHFGIGHMPHVGDTVHGHEVTEIMFGGLSHMGLAALVFGVVVLVVGHLLVFALGITSAGLQAIRLEYVEFLQKFYEGGGDSYDPFGYDRQFTTEE